MTAKNQNPQPEAAGQDTGSKSNVSLRGIIRKLRLAYSASQKPPAPGAGAPPGGPTVPSKGVPIPSYPYPVQVVKKEEEKKKKKKKGVKEAEKVPGVEIIKRMPPGRAVKLEEKEPLTGVNISYPLIPKKPKTKKDIFAYANVRWHPKLGEVVYYLVEPKISEEDKEAIKKIKYELEERLDIDTSKLTQVKAKEVLKEEIRRTIEDLKLEIPPDKIRAIEYYIDRDTLGYGPIHALMKDPNIEDLSCDGVNVPIYAYHRDPRFASLKTSVYFKDEDDLNSFVIKLAQMCNKTISIADPLLDGTLPDGSRVQATLGTDIARKGSNFTIRKFTEKPLTPTQILKYKTLDPAQLAYLWMAVENGMTILISGGTATGKTALLNVLSLFIRPELKVVSIEDTAELRLPLPHWIPHVARTPMAIKGKVGEVTLFDLLKSSLRQRPDYLVLGEVRGKEAFVLFQQIATGHPAMATIHAASIPQLIDRLITPPISLPPGLIENLDIIVFLTLSRLKGSYVRRAKSIIEMVKVEDGKPITNTLFDWAPVSDSMVTKNKSLVLKKIAEKMGISEKSVQQELINRKHVLNWLVETNKNDIKEVAKIISAYYNNPERVLDIVTG